MSVILDRPFESYRPRAVASLQSPPAVSPAPPPENSPRPADRVPHLLWEFHELCGVLLSISRDIHQLRGSGHDCASAMRRLHGERRVALDMVAEVVEELRQYGVTLPCPSQRFWS